MVISKRTTIALAVGATAMLLPLLLGALLKWLTPPEPYICCPELEPSFAADVLAGGGVALILGSFGAAVRSVVIDNSAARTGSGARPIFPTLGNDDSPDPENDKTA